MNTFNRTRVSASKTPAIKVSIVLFFLSAFSCLEVSAAKQPNLLFILTDQQSYDMLGCYGNKQLITPNIDKIASEGVRFNYCISSNPVCSPMRAMLLSGHHSLKNGVVSNDIQMLPGNGKYFAEVLRDSGYRTGYIGKWHLYGGDRERPVPPGKFRYGFDDTFQQQNLFGDPKHKALQDKMHALTQKWLRKYNDAFINGYDMLDQLGLGRIKTDGGLAGKGTESILPGRPVDILKAKKK